MPLYLLRRPAKRNSLTTGACILLLCLQVSAASAVELPATGAKEATMTESTAPVNLRCEYQRDPIGIDVAQPRLSWEMAAPEGARQQGQSAYRVLVASSPEQLAAHTGDLWDSGRVTSDQSVQVTFAGQPLRSRLRCHWMVQVWDNRAVASAWSRPAQWTVGLLSAADWKGQWVGAPAAGNAAPFIRKEVRLDRKPLRAVARICGLGYYELRINGRKVGDRELDPGFTDFTRRVQYVTYDVTEWLQTGTNSLGVILGNGWYHLPTRDLFGFQKAPWTAAPRLNLDIELQYGDGATDFVGSDASWKWDAGPITFNCIRAGETIDARRDKPGWDKPGYDDSAWAAVTVMEAPAGKLQAQQPPPIRITQTVPAVGVTQPKPGVYVFDLGTTLTGHVRFRVAGQAGQTLRLKHNELLNADGTVDMRRLSSHTSGGRFQTEEFILSGRGPETFEPRFTYHGFRYVQVEGLATPPVPDDLVGLWVHSDPEAAGTFTSSDPKLNRLQQLIVLTQLCNLMSIPTDCPQREKMGWLQDGCVTEEEAIYNFGMATFYTKWLDDILDSQDSNGHVPGLAPNCGWGKAKPDGSPGIFTDPWWGSALCRTAWNLYLYYGDRRVLEQAYPGMKAYTDYLSSLSRDGVAYGNLGDWLEVGTQNSAKRTPIGVTGTAAYYLCARITRDTAALLGKREDAARYASLATNILSGFNKRFVDAAGINIRDSQTSYALALELGLAPADRRERIVKQLVDNVVNERAGHLSTGIVGTHYLFYALSNAGRADLAYDVLMAPDEPGFFHWINQGATALWEQWDGNNSHCHPTFGSVGAWFYQALAGIRPDPSAPGFKKILIQPNPVGKLQWAAGQYDSPYGRITSRWELRDGRIYLEVTIPPNTSAVMTIPTEDAAALTESGRPVSESQGVKVLRCERHVAVCEVASGRYCFSAPHK